MELAISPVGFFFEIVEFQCNVVGQFLIFKYVGRVGVAWRVVNPLWFGGTSGFWFADLLMCLVGIKEAERGGLPYSTSWGSAQISPHLLGGSLSFSLNSCPPGNPFDSVAEEWRKRYVLFPWAVLTGGPIFLQKTLCFNPRMSPLCGEISLKLPKANRMENKRQLTLIVLFIYIT